MPVRETEVTANAILLKEHETTGPLPIGFGLEWGGTRYDHFEVSTDGVIAFVRVTHQMGLPNRVWLADGRTRLGGGRVTYEVRGVAPRRRLVVSLADEVSLGTTIRVTVHERTGIVELDPGGQSFGEPTMRQLDIVHSSPSRANSARKIG
ncbi:MAG TPA: hypothetical protein VF061_05655 [Gemmatimonadales bacterium]